MTRLRIAYDKAAGLWEARDLDRDTVSRTSRVILDAPARADGRYLTCEAAYANGNPAEMRVGIPEPVAGKVMPREMREWCAVWDENVGKWALWRHEGPTVLVTTERLSIECHAITSGGVLHCLAEMLANGATNRRTSIVDAASVRLRTLAVFDQKVTVPVLAAAAVRARGLGGRADQMVGVPVIASAARARGPGGPAGR